MIGDIKDGILVREDMDIPEYEWHHIFLHELMVRQIMRST